MTKKLKERFSKKVKRDIISGSFIKEFKEIVDKHQNFIDIVTVVFLQNYLDEVEKVLVAESCWKALLFVLGNVVKILLQEIKS